MKWFRDKSLRFKINFFVFLSIVLLVGLGLAMFVIADKSLNAELIKRGLLIVRRLAESHSYQVSLGLADELKPIIDKLMEDKGIEYVEFVDTEGRIIQTGDGQFKAQSDPAKRPGAYNNFSLGSLQQTFKQGHIIQSNSGEDLYDFYAPVEVVTSSGTGQQKKII